MGMFDTVICEFNLPETRHLVTDFQTKSLNCELKTYLIDSAGGLWVALNDFDEPKCTGWMKYNHHGTINIYTMFKEDWLEFKLIYKEGCLHSVKRVEDL